MSQRTRNGHEPHTSRKRASGGDGDTPCPTSPPVPELTPWDGVSAPSCDASRAVWISVPAAFRAVDTATSYTSAPRFTPPKENTNTGRPDCSPQGGEHISLNEGFVTGGEGVSAGGGTNIYQTVIDHNSMKYVYRICPPSPLTQSNSWKNDLPSSTDRWRLHAVKQGVVRAAT